MKGILEGLLNFFKQTDKWLLGLCVVCSGFSLLMLYSVYRNGFIQSSRSVWIQLIATLVGLALAIVISCFDYELIAKFWKFHLPLGIMLVVLTYFIGIQVEGATDKAWLDLGFTTFQPSEFLKISYIVTFAYHLSKVKDEINRPKNIGLLLLHAGAITGLIVIQQDYGTVLIFLCISITMLVMAGLSWKYIAAGIVLLPVVGVLAWNFFFNDMHRNRVLVAFNPDMDPSGTGYQQIRGRMALGSGQIFGRGLFSDDLISVPEMRNDFIFSYIGQTLGLVGCLAAVILLAVICLRILYVSRLSHDVLGRNICVGVFAFIFFQSIVNIGMVLCVMPVIGVTLPFFSSGGSSMMTMFMTVGLVLSVYHKNRRRTMFD